MFRKWYYTEIFEVRVNTEYKQYNLSNYIDDNVINLYDLHATGDLPAVCEFPNVSPVEHSVLKLSGMQKNTIKCEGTFMLDLTYLSGTNEIRVNASKVKTGGNVDDFQHCRYQEIFRHETNDNNVQYSKWSKPFTDSVILPKNAEFVKVECTNRTSAVVSKTFYSLLPRREDLNETDLLNLKRRQVLSAPKDTLNIIMIGMDTLPRNQFIRGCNKAYSYLMNTLKSFDLTLHSQLGENTFPNFLPLFVGQSYNEITSWWSDEQHLDSFDMIWNTFEKAGYLTLYTEDWPEVGAFHYLKKGFRKPFARYNTRPLTLAMSRDTDIWKYNKCCAGNQVEMNFLLDYVSRFLDTFSDKPVFAVATISKPTHDHPIDAKMFDEHLLNFYHSLNQNGHLNRSLLISFSDHGVRWGALRNSGNGHFESRTPYTILTFPDWFLRKYPDVSANLKVNTKRLTSHFDTHATLLDLLYFKSTTPPPLAPLRHGMSLFQKIPWDRTCKDAYIPLEYCLCEHKSLEDINTASETSQLLANLVLNAVNLKTDKHVCVVFRLHTIIRIIKITLNNNNSNYKNVTTVYKVTLETDPGKAVFEANVYAEINSAAWKVANDIHRLNLYRGQAGCINIAEQQPFCYCKNMLSK
ncbi:hypothetical protein BsWGS_24915 [Bradybaena similaris]